MNGYKYTASTGWCCSHTTVASINIVVVQSQGATTSWFFKPGFCKCDYLLLTTVNVRRLDLMWLSLLLIDLIFWTWRKISLPVHDEYWDFWAIHFLGIIHINLVRAQNAVIFFLFIMYLIFFKLNAQGLVVVHKLRFHLFLKLWMNLVL